MGSFCPECEKDNPKYGAGYSAINDDTPSLCGEHRKGIVEYNSGFELVDGFIAACKRLDPSLRKISIKMKGDFNRDIEKDFPR